MSITMLITHSFLNQLIDTDKQLTEMQKKIDKGIAPPAGTKADDPYAHWTGWSEISGGGCCGGCCEMFNAPSQP